MSRRKPDAALRLSRAVARVSAAATLARAVADHVPISGRDSVGTGGQLECLDAIERWMLRPAVAELQEAHEKASADLLG